ncbi:hypothetical protein ACRALDRAFT_1072589 [Sodiomyces alcalophilus JCM 7366]|uniref:uncharacterized protein n=1 Tax=Sodiomyces alcalophilus JCM 7366 TaxID=591952 RepID=UPI0039B6207E
MAPAAAACNLGEEPESPPLYYFAYGSNLSPTQMLARCPDSEPLCLAHLPHPWSWLINARGYANVVHKSYPDSTSLIDGVGPGALDGTAPETKTKEDSGSGNHDMGPGVYGVLYTLGPDDEAQLDLYEGVPYAYEKVMLPVQLIGPSACSHKSPSSSPCGGCEPVKQERKEAGVPTVDALVYVDFRRVVPDVPRSEYIARMNRAIHEAQLSFGLPADYVRDVMREFIPEGGWEGAGIAPED